MTKAWERVDAIGRRAFWNPRTVLVTGAGPIGLLAALLGMQRGLDVHVLDRVDSGLKPDLVRALGASYHAGNVAGIAFQPDIIVECTGVGPIISELHDSKLPPEAFLSYGHRQWRREQRGPRSRYCG